MLVNNPIVIKSRKAQRRKDKSCCLCAFVRTSLLLRALANLRDVRIIETGTCSRLEPVELDLV